MGRHGKKTDIYKPRRERERAQKKSMLSTPSSHTLASRPLRKYISTILGNQYMVLCCGWQTKLTQMVLHSRTSLIGKYGEGRGYFKSRTLKHG